MLRITGRQRLLVGFIFFYSGLLSIFVVSLAMIPLPAPASSLPKTLLSFALTPADVAQAASSSEHATTSSPFFAAPSNIPRLIIPKIGVDMEIVLKENNERVALRRGAWLIPGTAAPDDTTGYNNTVLSGHRYLYTKGPRTFFNLDKLRIGDKMAVIWLGKTFRYTVVDTAVVKPTAVNILNKTPKKVLTLFTCTPVYTTKNRLVVRAVLD